MTITRRRWMGAALAATAAILSACASGPGISPTDTALSLVYGNIDMKDAPTPVDEVAIRCYNCPEDQRLFYSYTGDGFFYAYGLPKGPAQIDYFRGQNVYLGIFGGTPHRYSFGGSGRNESAVVIGQPGAYSMGSWAFVLHKGENIFKPDSFSVKPGRMTEKEILARVIKHMQGESAMKPYQRALDLAQRRYAELR